MITTRAKAVLNNFKSRSFEVVHETENSIAIALAKRTNDLSYLINTRVYILVTNDVLILRVTIKYHDMLPTFSYSKGYTRWVEGVDLIATTLRNAYLAMLEYIMEKP